MIHHRTRAEVRRLDIFKLIVTIILALLLLALFIFQPVRTSSGPAQSDADTGAVADAPTDTPAATEPPAEESAETGQTDADVETEPTPEESAEVAVTMPELSAPQPGAELEAGEIELSGRGQPGAEVEILVDGQVVGVAQVAEDGAWSYSVTLDEPGDHEIALNGLDAEGQVAVTSEPVGITVVAPPVEIVAPELTAPAAGDDLTAGEIELAGRGQPGTEVEIVVDGQVVGVAQVAQDGAWSYSVTLDKPGEYEISLNALDAAGQVATTSAPVSLVVAAPPVEIAAPVLTAPTPDDALTPGELTLSGTGQPDTEVEIVIDGQVVATAPVDSEGNWSFTAGIDAPGEYQISLNGLNADGAVAASSEPVSIVVAKPAAEASEQPAGVVCEEEYVVVADDWLSKLSDKYWSDIFLYPAIVAATNQMQTADDTFANIANPDLIEPGWKLCIVDADTAQALTADQE